SGPVEGHVETDIQLWFAIRLRIRTVGPDGCESHGLSAASWACVLAGQENGHSCRLWSLQRPVCNAIPFHHVPTASRRSCKCGSTPESHRCGECRISTEPVSVHTNSGYSDAGADCRELFPEWPG